MVVSPLGHFGHVDVSFPPNFFQTQKRYALFHRIACDYSNTDLVGLRDHLRDVLLVNFVSKSSWN